ncbi:MAG: hypothetical protein NT131_00475 [Methanomassiliicoccales archaeon]|nr:hypothetical protein [Methanomassiliicoccales archaeon]
MPDIIDHLQKLGLSEYEAKAYVAAVALGEGTIKEISEESKVPRSRAYDIMERLLEKGFVEAGNTVPRCYRANDPAEAFDHLIVEIESSRDEVVKALDEIGQRAERRDNPIWTIKGEWAIDHKVSEMLDSAQKDVVIISLHNSYLRRYAKQIARVSAEKPITVLIAHDAEGFVGLLGKARTIKLSDKMLSPPEPFMTGTMDLMPKDPEYDVELLMVCDHGDSMVLSKEGNGHRAIISSGTVVDYFINRIMEMAMMEARGGE